MLVASAQEPAALALPRAHGRPALPLALRALAEDAWLQGTVVELPGPPVPDPERYPSCLIKESSIDGPTTAYVIGGVVYSRTDEPGAATPQWRRVGPLPSPEAQHVLAYRAYFEELPIGWLPLSGPPVAEPDRFPHFGITAFGGLDHVVYLIKGWTYVNSPGHGVPKRPDSWVRVGPMLAA